MNEKMNKHLIREGILQTIVSLVERSLFLNVVDRNEAHFKTV